MLRIFFNPFEYKEFSWAFSCESKKNPKKMYSNGLKNILKII